MDNSNQQRPSKSGLLPLILTIGGFCLFAIIIAYAWKDHSPSTVARGGLTPVERFDLLRLHREEADKNLTTYGWVNKEEGVVRIPIERAMELTLKDLNQGQTPN
jgi:hypothetical protein